MLNGEASTLDTYEQKQNHRRYDDVYPKESANASGEKLREEEPEVQTVSHQPRH